MSQLSPIFKGEFLKEKKEEKEDDLIGEEGSGDNLPLQQTEFNNLLQDKLSYDSTFSVGRFDLSRLLFSS